MLAKRKVTTLDALSFAKENNMDFCEVSARSSENIEVAMRRLIMTVSRSLMEQDEALSSLNAGHGHLPPGWIEIVDSCFYENVWTGQRQMRKPSAGASQGKLIYSRPLAELEKIDVTFAKIKGLRSGPRKTRTGSTRSWSSLARTLAPSKSSSPRGRGSRSSQSSGGRRSPTPCAALSSATAAARARAGPRRAQSCSARRRGSRRRAP